MLPLGFDLINKFCLEFDVITRDVGYLNKAMLNKAILHTDTHKHTYTDADSALKTPVRESQPQKKPEPFYPMMGVEGRPQFSLTDSRTPLFHSVTSALLSPRRGTPRLRYHSTTRQQQREKGVQYT